MLLLRPLRALLGQPRLALHLHTSSAYWASAKALRRFRLADIGEGITECEVIKWYVNHAWKLFIIYLMPGSLH